MKGKVFCKRADRDFFPTFPCGDFEGNKRNLFKKNLPKFLIRNSKSEYVICEKNKTVLSPFLSLSPT
jgi:hypothetical protein